MRERFPHTTVVRSTNPFEDDVSGTDAEFAGQRGLYKLFFVGSPVMALLDGPVPVGARATIFQTEDAVVMKHTDVLTLPSRGHPVLREVRHLLRSRPGIVITVVTVPFTFPDADWSSAARDISQEAEAALAALVLLLDDRIAYRRLGEMITITRDDGSEQIMDITRAVRPYDSDLESRVRPQTFLGTAADFDLGQDPAIEAGLKCYLAAIEQAKTPIGFILLCSALEALCHPSKGKPSFNKKELIAALAEYGIEANEESMRGIVRARAIVHHGFIEDAYLYATWAVLEEYVRRILRVRLKANYGWPIRVPKTSAPATFTYALLDEDLREVETEPPAELLRQEVDALERIDTEARKVAAPQG